MAGGGVSFARWIGCAVVVGLVAALPAIEVIAAAPAAADPPGYADVILGDDPAVYYRMGDGQGDELVDASGNGYDAQVYFPNGSSDVVFGAGGALSGDSDTAVGLVGGYGCRCTSTPLLPLGNSARTVEAWIYIDVANTHANRILGWGDPSTRQAFVFSVKENTIGIGAWGTGEAPVVTLAQGLNDSTWHYVAMTYDGSGTNAYVDGIYVGSTVFTGALNTTTSVNLLGIGAWNDANDVFNGGIDEAAIYSTALSSERIAQHYAAGGRVPGGPVAPDELLGRNPSVPNACHASAGDPVDVATGNFHEEFADLAVGGRGPGLVFSRSYNSLNAGTDGPLGFGWTSGYLMSLAVDVGTGTVTIRQESGSVVRFTAAGDGYVAPPRVTATLTANLDGSWTFVRGAREVITFDDAGRLVSIADLNGETTALSYGLDGSLESVEDPAARQLTIGWDDDRIVSVTGPSDGSTGSQELTFDYDGAGDLVSATDVAGGTWVFGYDDHLMTTIQSPRQEGSSPAVVTTNHYDGEGRVDSQTDPLTHETTFDYTTTPGSTIVTDPDGAVTVHRFENGVCASRTEGFGTPEEATWTFERDNTTLGLTRITDPSGHVTVNTFDTAGNLTSTTDPLGRTTTITYNELRQPLTVTRPLTADNEHTVTTTSTYDSAGNLLTVSTPLLNSEDEEIDTQTVTVHHDDGTHPGDVTSVDDPRDKTWTYTYDTYGNRTSTTDPVGNETTVAHNIAGWPTENVSPRGNEEGADPADFTTSFAHNPTGQVTAVTDPLDQTTTRTYDANGNLATVTDPNTHTTTYIYDDADRLTEIERADTSTLTNEYTPAGHLAVQRDAAGEATTYTYDALGRVVSVEDELSRTVEFGYDEAGNTVSRQEDGGDCAATPATGCTLFAYDDADQLTGIDYSDATPDVSAIAYDGLGRRVASTDGTGSSSWAWDSLGRLVSHTDATSRTVDYGYDLASNLTSLTYPDAIGAVTRTYDDAGRWTAVTDWNDNTASFDYDPDGNLTTVTFPTGAGDTDTSTYDPDGRVDTIDFADDTVSYASLDYGRDDLGQVTAETPTGLPGTSHAYTYDPINRLDTLDTDPYSYDTADNLALLPDGTTQQFDTAHQLCFQSPGALTGTCGTPPIDAATYTYDSRGNRTSTQPAGQDPTTFTYDLANRLTTATQPTGDPAEGTWTYGYNSDGLRVTRTNPTDTTTHFTWNTAESLPLVLTETDGTNTHAYIYGPDGLVIEDTDGVATRWYHHDQLGTTRTLTDNTGAPLATYSYDPYGNPAGATGTDTTPFGYTGQYTDTETGLLYLRARYYDPATGQFLTRDPIEAITGEPYAYTSNDPLSNTDPAGLFSYHFDFDLGRSSLSPRELFSILRANFGEIFPLTGAPDVLPGEGENVNLSVYGKAFPVTVTDVWSTGFRLDTRFGHPDWPGWISFDFTKDTSCHLHLQLKGHVPDFSGGSLPGAFIFRKRAYRGLSHHIWGTFVDNLRDTVQPGRAPGGSW